MKRNMVLLVLASGWIFLGLFLWSGQYYNQVSSEGEGSTFKPILWADHLQVFNGAIQCSLSDEDLMIRKRELKEKLLSKYHDRSKADNSITLYFDDDEEILEDAIEFVMKEKACCPFFKFDLSILPFKKGFALRISGPEGAIEMMEELEMMDI